MTDTPESKIAKHQALKAHIKTQSDAFATYLAPFKEEQAAIDNWLLDYLNKAGLEKVSSAEGTAYKSTITVPKITNRNEFIDWCWDNWDQYGNAMLQVGAPQVTAFKEFMEKYQTVPAGTSVDHVNRLNIRKA